MGFYNTYVFIILQCIPRTVSFLFLRHSIWSHIFSPLSLSRPILVYVRELSEQRNTVCVVYISFNIFSNVFLVFWFFFLSQKVGITCTNQLFFFKCECEKVWVNESGVHFLANNLVLGDLFLFNSKWDSKLASTNSINSMCIIYHYNSC